MVREEIYMKSKTILLTNGLQRKTLAVTRSLGSKGIRVICSDTTYINPTAFSKYCDVSLVYPNPTEKPEKFVHWLIKTIGKYSCDIVFPMDDDTMGVIVDNYEQLSKLCAFPIPSKRSYKIAAHKGSSIELAGRAGISCPKTFNIKSLDQIDEIAVNLEYPIIIKPTKSSGSRGIKRANNALELKKLYRKVHLEYPYPLIQEYIEPLQRYDVCLIFDRKGTVKASFVQKELRQFPIDMGPSTMQESIYSQELIDMALEIMKKLKWCGVVELEFITDRKDGKIKFMEINPRFWSSLYVSIISGIDFPDLLYKIGTTGTVEETFEYKEGVKCRWLLPGDILHFLSNRDRLRMRPPIWHGKRQGIEDDTMSEDDPLPALGVILAIIYNIFNLKMWRQMFFR